MIILNTFKCILDDTFLTTQLFIISLNPSLLWYSLLFLHLFSGVLFWLCIIPVLPGQTMMIIVFQIMARPHTNCDRISDDDISPHHPPPPHVKKAMYTCILIWCPDKTIHNLSEIVNLYMQHYSGRGTVHNWKGVLHKFNSFIKIY